MRFTATILANTLGWWLTCSVVISIARAEIPEANPGAFSFAQAHWSLEEGLPSEIVTSLAQSPDGFLWIGNFGALTRFDGVALKTYPGSLHSALAGMQVYELVADGGGRVWFRDLNGAVGYVKDGQARRLSATDGLPAEGAEKMSRDHQQRLCFRGRDGAFYRFEGERLVRLPVRGFDAREADVIAVTGDGVWIVHDTLRTVHLAKPDRDVIQALLRDAPTDLKAGRFFRLADGSLGLTTSYGIYHLTDGEWRPYRTVSKSITGSGRGILDACQTLDGTIWIGTYPLGVLVLPPSGVLHRLRLDNGGDSYIRAIFTDLEGQVWIGNSGGLYRLRPAPFQNFSAPEGLTFPRIESVVSHDGDVWFTSGSTIYLRAKGSETFQPIPLKPAAEATRLALGSDGSILSGSRDGIVYRIRDAKCEVLGDAGLWVHCILEDERGNVFAGTDRGVYRLGKNGFRKDRLPGTSLNVGILALELAPDGQAHILTTAGQLFTHSGTQWSKIATPEKFTALCFDSDSRLWAASRTSSIFFREDDEWRQMDLRIQQGPVTVHDLHMDRSGSLWVVGHPGILRVPAESLFDRSIRRLGTSEGVVPFGKEDGLGSTVATLGGSSISEDDSGWLWLATVGGLARTSLKRFSDSALDRPSPLAHIEAAKIDEEEADQSPPLRIPITASHFEIAFTGTLLGKPEKSRFRYRLGGPEDPWVGADKQRRASFLRPAAGSYTFEVQAIGSDGVVGPLTASLPVIVEPFWWERVSIQFGMLVLLLGIVVIVARWRIQLIQAHSNLQERFSRDLIESQEEERKRIAQDLHDSLGQELLVLNAHTEKAALEHADIADEMQSQSHRILAAIEETRRIAYGLRPPHLEMIGLGPLLEALAEDIETSSGIQVISDIADLDPRLPPEHEINLYRIAQEALGNAVKYSNASEIRLVLQKTPNGIELSIRDDGSGFSRTPRQPSASLGLTGMEQRSRFLGGSFNCQTAKGKGTQITVRIPVR